MNSKPRRPPGAGRGKTGPKPIWSGDHEFLAALAVFDWRQLDLARAYRIDPRTVRRYVERLRDRGVNVPARKTNSHDIVAQDN